MALNGQFCADVQLCMPLRNYSLTHPAAALDYWTKNKQPVN